MVKNDIVINCDDIMSTNGDDVQPEFVEMQFNEGSLKTIARAILVLQENKDFNSIVVTNLSWSVNEDYSGKDRNGKLIIWLSNGKPRFTFRFTNDWTGTEYFVDLLDEIAEPLINAGPLGKNWVEYENLFAWYGEENADKLFDAFKATKPTAEISPDFARQVIAKLPEWDIQIEKIDWGLESEDSDTNLQWCEQCKLSIPLINAQVFIEVGDNHYYVCIETADGNREDETFRHWERIPEFIQKVLMEDTAPVYARLVFDDQREFQFGLLTYTDPLCTDQLDDFWHSSSEDRERSVSAWGYVLINKGESNA